MKLWRHQDEAIPRLLAGHYALWWGAGVGKTAPLAVAGRNVGGTQLWLTLNTLLGNQTAQQIALFRKATSRIQVIPNSNCRVDRGADVIVCSYSLARTLPIWRQLYALEFTSLVLDEAHLLANTASARTRAVYGANVATKAGLWQRARRVWPSSGTPVLNSPHDLWPHMSRLWPSPALPSKAAWEARYCVMKVDPENPGRSQVVGGKNLDELGARLDRHGSRITMEQAHPNMPALMVDTLPVRVDAGTATELADAFADIAPETMEQMHIALAQMEGGEAAMDYALEALLLPTTTLRRLLALAKALEVAEQVAAEIEAGADRIIVFGHHTEALNIIARRLPPHMARMLTGATGPAARKDAVDAFNAGRAQVLVANMKVGGTGLNLQAGRRVIFLEADWTPANNAQAIARCHRAGQTRPVHVSFAYAEGTLDQAVQRVLSRKALMIDAILRGVN